VAEERSVTHIESLRKRIDELDEQLVRLLSARAACALEVGRAKKAAGVEIYQPTREAEVLEHVAKVNRGPLDNGAIRRLFERIIDEARRLERVADGQEDPHDPLADGSA
jgi:chorismate mutase